MPGPHGKFSSRQQEIEFQQCFIELSDLMTQTGVINNGAQGVAEVFCENLLRLPSSDDIIEIGIDYLERLYILPEKMRFKYI